VLISGAQRFLLPLWSQDIGNEKTAKSIINKSNDRPSEKKGSFPL